MKDTLVPIEQAGRIVLPKNVRQELAIQPGDMLLFSMHGMHVTLAPSEAKAGFQRKGTALVFTTTREETFGHEVVDSVLTEARSERMLPAESSRPAKKRKG